MIKHSLIAAAVLVISAGPALAGHCPKDVKKLEAAMTSMDAGKMSMAKDAATKGAELHAAGKHGESLKVLHAAMKEHGIKH